MDLEFDHPPASVNSKTIKKIQKVNKEVPHANRYSQAGSVRGTRDLIRDIKKPKLWRWSGCRCHCITEDEARSNQDLMYVRRKPWRDSCLDGDSWYCNEAPGLKPGKCFLGATGWLLSCHMAYIEGVEVLYGTNTLHLSRPILLRRMTELFLPQRLHSIQFIELIWDVGQRKSPGVELEVKLSPTRDVITELVRIVPNAFPNLQKAHITLLNCYSIDDINEDPNPFARAAEADILVPIDNMVRKLPLLRDMYVGLPESVVQLRSVAQDEMDFSMDIFDRAWRSVVPASNPSFDTANSINHPQPIGADTAGYWLIMAQEDIVNPMRGLGCCMGEPPAVDPMWTPSFGRDAEVGAVIPGSSILWVYR
ncbi:hypothetical protein BGZ63DRAFT_394992 [Mariannaea sp. PMI_226]|nr:hypothetical protein BGZ63DRAFT_394992 [Mariannaea sp. PMI_226]